MSKSHLIESPDGGHAEVEAMVRAARHYVRPSDDLRPRILEAAREHCGDRRAEQKLGTFALAVLVLVLVSSPAITFAAALRSTIANRSANQVHLLAAELANDREIGSQWALAEAFSQVRHLQASRLGRSNHRMK